MPEEKQLMHLMMEESNPILKFVTCSICKGFIINAMTINECLHTFCRSCIWKHFAFSLFCPECNAKAHQARPLSSLQPDTTKQEIIYKLFPKLLLNEMAQRGGFWRKYPEITEKYNQFVEYGCGVEMDTLKICVTLERNKKSNVVCLKDDLIDAGVSINKIFIRLHSDAPMSCLKKFIINKLNNLGEQTNSLKVYLVRHKNVLSDDVTIYSILTRNDFKRCSLPVEFVVCKPIDNLKSASNRCDNFHANLSDNSIDVRMKEAEIFSAFDKSSSKDSSVSVTDDEMAPEKSSCGLMKSPQKPSPNKIKFETNASCKKDSGTSTSPQPLVENWQPINDNEENHKRLNPTSSHNLEVPPKRLCNRSKIGKPVKVTSLIRLDSNKQQTHQTIVPPVVSATGPISNPTINSLHDGQSRENASVPYQPVIKWITAKSLSTNETVSPKVVQNNQVDEVITIPSSLIPASSMTPPAVESCNFYTCNGIVRRKSNNLESTTNERTNAAVPKGYTPQSFIRIASESSNKSSSMEKRFAKPPIRRPIYSSVPFPVVKKKSEQVQRLDKNKPIRSARHVSIINSLLPKSLSPGAVTNTAKFLHNQSNNLQTKSLFGRPFLTRSTTRLNTNRFNSNAAHSSKAPLSIIPLERSGTFSIPFRNTNKLPEKRLIQPPSLIRMNSLQRYTNTGEKKMITVDFSQASSKKALTQSRPFVVQNKVKLKPTTPSLAVRKSFVLKLPFKSKLLPQQSSAASTTRTGGSADETRPQDLPSTSHNSS